VVFFSPSRQMPGPYIIGPWLLPNMVTGSQMGDGSLTPSSFWIVCQQDETLISQTAMYITKICSFITSTLMMETEELYKILDFNSTLTRLMAWEDFSTFIHQESFKSYITICYIIKVKLSRLPYFLDNWLTDGDEVVKLTRQLAALYPPGRFLVPISARG
jgi:hypothetical protein